MNRLVSVDFERLKVMIFLDYTQNSILTLKLEASWVSFWHMLWKKCSFAENLKHYVKTPRSRTVMMKFHFLYHHSQTSSFITFDRVIDTHEKLNTWIESVDNWLNVKCKHAVRFAYKHHLFDLTVYFNETLRTRTVDECIHLWEWSLLHKRILSSSFVLFVVNVWVVCLFI